MNLKSLIFADSGEDKKSKATETKKPDAKTFKSKFPSDNTMSTPKKDSSFKASSTFNSKTSFPNATSVPASVDAVSCGPHLDNIMSMYEQGFDSLNQSGYDFYEYFKSVIKVGSDNPEMYKMAFTMGQSMEPTVSKASLVNQSKFYIDEITSVHRHYVETGKSKLDEMVRLKESEESGLRQEIIDVEAEIERLKAIRNQKTNELSTIDGKYANEIHDVKCKLMANDVARDSIISSINKVVTGINNNI